MNILTALQTLGEDDLRKKIIIPLLYALGCIGVRDNCGRPEKGKDVIYINNRHFLKNDIWGAVIIKDEKIRKNKKLDSIAAIFRQINEAITPFIKPDDPRAKIQIHELILITSQDITDEAQQYIYENSGKCFPNIQYIDGHRLTHLINEVILEYNKNKSENYIFSVETFSSICNAPEIESVSSSASAVIEGSMAN